MRDLVLFLDSSTTGLGPLYFERARSLGLVPVLVSKKSAQHKSVAGFASIRVPGMNVTAIIAAIDQIGRERVAGICSALSQRAELVARVASALGLPHSDPAAVSVCCDKLLTRKTLAAAGINDVGFEVAHSGADAASAARRLGGSVIIKPRVSSGATGVRVCNTPAEAREHTEFLIAENSTHAALGVVVEELIAGPQFGVEIFDGKSLGVRRKHISQPPASVPIGHDFPAMDPPEVCAAIATHAERATSAAGYVRGPAHVELRYGKGGPCLIEINPRVAGALGPENVRRAIGVDIIECYVRFACGLPYDLSRRTNRASCVRHLLRDGAPVRTILGREDAMQVPGVVEVGMFPDWFSRTGPARSYEDRIAYVISEADTPAEAIASADEGLRQLQLVEEPAWRNRLSGIKRLVWAD